MAKMATAVGGSSPTAINASPRLGYGNAVRARALSGIDMIGA